MIDENNKPTPPELPTPPECRLQCTCGYTAKESEFDHNHDCFGVGAVTFLLLLVVGVVSAIIIGLFL